MIKYIIGILLLSSLFGCKEPPIDFVINGEVAGIEGAKVALFDQKHVLNIEKDSGFAATHIKNNRFLLKGSVPEAGFYDVIFYGKSNVQNGRKPTYFNPSCMVYIDKGGKYTFIANSENDLLYNRYIIKTNVDQQTRYANFNREEQRFWTENALEKSALEEKLSNVNEADSVKYNAMFNQLMKFRTESSDGYFRLIHSFVLKNKDAVYTPYLIMKVSDVNKNYALYQRALNNLAPVLKGNRYTKLAEEYVANARKRMEKRAVLPDISAVSLSGEKFDLTKYRNKKMIVLSLWASWCTPCIEEINFVKSHPNQFPSDVEFVFLSADTHEDAWKKKSSELHLSNNFLLSDGSRNELLKLFNIVFIPQNISVTPAGKVIMAFDFGADDPRFLVEMNAYLKKQSE